MLKLLIDVGNTRIKAATYDTSLTTLPAIDWRNVGTIESAIADWPIEGIGTVHICSVAQAELAKRIESFCKTQWDARVKHTLNLHDSHGLTCGYADRSQLGLDRWVAMQGAWQRYQTAILVVDAGTAVTIDLIDNNGLHHGGCILAGLNTQRNALSQNTADLPLVTDRGLSPFADNTADAIAQGTLHGIIGVIKHYHELASEKLHAPVKVCLTGGSAAPLAQHIAIADHHPDLVLEGIARLTC